jgi:concanavalin A-like lectin/glucanase superfamily protein/N,N-dimethylformamidase beta subunit-like protein/Big-like domain-containing protein
VPAQQRQLRFWRGIDFGPNPGPVTSLAPGTLGFEWGSDLDNGYRPAGLIQLSSTTKSNMPVIHDYGTPSGYFSDTATHNMTFYRHTSGALVFAASTVQWSWGLDNHHTYPENGSVVDDRMKQATVNLLADMGVQPGSLQAPQTAASPSNDLTPPSSTITAPVSSSTVQLSGLVTISGTAVDTNGLVAGVEVSVDGGVTWHPATGIGSWSYTWTPATLGAATIKSRAVDDSGNVESPSAGVAVSVTPTTCSCGGCNTGAPSSKSLSLNGTNALVQVPNSQSINITGPLTVEAWIKTEAANTQQGIVERYGTPGRNLNGGYALRLLANGKLGFYTLSDGGYLYDFLQGSTTVTTSVWHHVAGVFDGGQMRVYLDGVLDGAKSSTLAPAIGTTNLMIGARGDDATKFFKGLIDEVRLTAGALYVTNFVPSIRLSANGNTRGLWRFESLQNNQVLDSSCHANNGSIQGTANLSSDVADPGSLGLVGHWKFDEGSGTTTTDASGNGNTGVLNGPGWTTGQVNNALNFDGTSSYVDMGAPTSLAATDTLTISAWIFPTGAGSNSTYGGTIAVKEGEYVLARFPDGTIQWGFANTNPGWLFVNTEYVAPLNQWTHIAVVYSNWSIQTYANGVLVHTYAGAGVIGDAIPSMNNFRVGGRQIINQFFQGKIDEVRVYNRGLSAPDVQSLANVIPVGDWRFDEINGTTTPDSSGNALTGTLNGPTLTAGRVNNALSFNGTTDYVQIGAQQSLVMSNSLTVSAWIFPTGAGSNSTYGGTIAVKEGEYVLARFPDGTIQWGFANTNPGWQFINTGQTAPLNQWTHIAVVYDGGTIKTYLNGTLAHTYNGAGVIGDAIPSMNDFRVGGRQVINQFFQGKIDEVRVYNFPLQDNEVAGLAQ